MGSLGKTIAPFSHGRWRECKASILSGRKGRIFLVPAHWAEAGGPVDCPECPTRRASAKAGGSMEEPVEMSAVSWQGTQWLQQSCRCLQHSHKCWAHGLTFFRHTVVFTASFLCKERLLASEFPYRHCFSAAVGYLPVVTDGHPFEVVLSLGPARGGGKQC